MTLRVKISMKVSQKGTQQRAENVKMPLASTLASTSTKEPKSAKATVIQHTNKIPKKNKSLRSEVYSRNNLFKNTMYSKKKIPSTRGFPVQV